MPEGDSIYKIAVRLRPVLVEQPLTRFELRDRGPVPFMVGKVVERIAVHGKHMMVHVQGRWVLHVHLGMHGRWRTYAGGLDYSFSRGKALAILGVGGDAIVCSNAAKARLCRTHDPLLERTLARLGPDLLGSAFDADNATRRAMTRREGTVAEVITDQRVASGIGNVYKSEVLFICGVNPHTHAVQIDAKTWREIFTCAADLMRANLQPGPRTSTGKHKGARHPTGVERFWVYRRRAAPCLRCKSPIERSELGDLARSTYWCPQCQPAVDATSAGSSSV